MNKDDIFTGRNMGCKIVDWPQSFLFLCYIYLAFLHFLSSASLIQVCVCGSDKGVK